MALAFVQSGPATGTPSGAGTSVTMNAITTTSGNLLVAAVTARSGSSLSVSDSKSNTWHDAISHSDGTNEVHVFYAYNITGGANHTVTLTSGLGAFLTLNVQEFSGVTTTNPLDKTTGAGGGLDSGSVSLTTSPELLVGACFNEANIVSAGAGYSNFQYYNASPSTGNTFGAIESQITSGGGSFNATFGGTPSQANTVIATFIGPDSTSTSTSSSTSISTSSTSTSSTSMSTSSTSSSTSGSTSQSTSTSTSSTSSSTSSTSSSTSISTSSTSHSTSSTSSSASTSKSTSTSSTSASTTASTSASTSHSTSTSFSTSSTSHSTSSTSNSTSTTTLPTGDILQASLRNRAFPRHSTPQDYLNAALMDDTVALMDDGNSAMGGPTTPIEEVPNWILTVRPGRDR